MAGVRGNVGIDRDAFAVWQSFFADFVLGAANASVPDREQCERPICFLSLPLLEKEHGILRTFGHVCGRLRLARLGEPPCGCVFSPLAQVVFLLDELSKVRAQQTCEKYMNIYPGEEFSSVCQGDKKWTPEGRNRHTWSHYHQHPSGVLTAVDYHRMEMRAKSFWIAPSR